MSVYTPAQKRQNVTLCVPRPAYGLDPETPVLAMTTLPAELPDNHVLIEVDRFGFSTNNITYQALGESPVFRYVSNCRHRA